MHGDLEDRVWRRNSEVQLSEDPLDRFSSSFHRTVDIWSEIVDMTFFFSDRTRDVAMATNLRVKMGEIGRLTPVSVCKLLFDKYGFM